MKEVIIDLWGHCPYKPVVKIDGKMIEYTRKEHSRYVINYMTDKEKISVSVYKYLEINGKFWFLWQLLYCFLSVFGLFDFRADRKCICYDLKFDLTLSQDKTNVSVKILKPKKTGFAADIKVKNGLWVTSNSFFVDKKARRRTLFMFFIKLALLAAAVIAVVFYFVNL